MFRFLQVLAVTTLLVCPALAAQATCESQAYEYCQIGCEVLGGFVVEPVPTLGAALDLALSLDPVERLSFSIAQPRWTASYVVVYRRLLARPQLPMNGWAATTWTTLAGAETSQEYLYFRPALIIETNDPDRRYVVVYKVPCMRMLPGRR